MNESYIPDGCILLARKLQGSDIWQKPPVWLKIWLYILQEVNHKDNKFFPRGTNLFNYKDIARDCSTTYDSVKHCSDWLKSATQIATRKTTRGVVISVVNYELYQSLESYKSHDESHTFSQIEAKSKPNRSHTINKNDKNDKNERRVTTTSYLPKPTQKHLIPLCVYAVYIGRKFLSKEEVSEFISRFAKVSKSLSVYDIQTLSESCIMAEHRSKGEYDITLETVGKNVDFVRSGKLPPDKKIRANKLSKYVQENLSNILTPTK